MNWDGIRCFMVRIMVYNEDEMKLGGFEGRLINNVEALMRFEGFLKVKKLEDEYEMV